MFLKISLMIIYYLVGFVFSYFMLKHESRLDHGNKWTRIQRLIVLGKSILIAVIVTPIAFFCLIWLLLEKIGIAKVWIGYWNKEVKW